MDGNLSDGDAKTLFGQTKRDEMSPSRKKIRPSIVPIVRCLCSICLLPCDAVACSTLAFGRFAGCGTRKAAMPPLRIAFPHNKELG